MTELISAVNAKPQFGNGCNVLEDLNFVIFVCAYILLQKKASNCENENATRNPLKMTYANSVCIPKKSLESILAASLWLTTVSNKSKLITPIW